MGTTKNLRLKSKTLKNIISPEISTDYGRKTTKAHTLKDTFLSH